MDAKLTFRCGHIALENLNLVVDTKSNRVIPNPESGGKFTLDLS